MLRGFGEWMRTHGESIYGTDRNPFDTEPESEKDVVDTVLQFDYE